MELTGIDYVTLPRGTIENHPSFSPHAFRIMLAISKMNTQEIEQIQIDHIIGGKSRG